LVPITSKLEASLPLGEHSIDDDPDQPIGVPSARGWARAWRNTLAVASSGAATRTSTPDAQARTAQEIRRAGREANRLGGKVGSLRRPAALRSIV